MKLNILFEGSIEEAKALGFDVDHILYHGTNEVFDKFNRSFSRTAKHIYTTPDPMTASNYGRIVYEVAPKKGFKIADLIDDHKAINFVADEISDHLYNDVKYQYRNINDFNKILHSDEFDKQTKMFAQQLINGLSNDSEEFEYSDEYDDLLEQLHKLIAKKEAIELIQSGKIYDYDYKGRLQDEIMDICYHAGYDCVRFIDPSSAGESESYVFEDGHSLYIIGQHKG
jgi:hypothetical protein